MQNIRPNDFVFHKPTREEWVVCGVDYERDELIPCGYPFPSIARLSDCKIAEARNEPQSEEMRRALKQHGLNRFLEGDTMNESNTKPTVYLAGKITGDPGYWIKFFNAADALGKAGFTALNPAILPSQGFEYEAYLRMSAAMLAECEAICMLPDWRESKGARAEFGDACAAGKRVLYLAEDGKSIHEWETTESEMWLDNESEACITAEWVTIWKDTTQTEGYDQDAAEVAEDE